MPSGARHGALRPEGDVIGRVATRSAWCKAAAGCAPAVDG